MDESLLKKLLPDIRGLIDPKAEQRVYLAFRQVYEYFDTQTKKLQDTIDQKLSTQAANIAQQSQLVNGFATQLIGIQNQTNPLATLGSGNLSNFTVAAGGNLTGGGTVNTNGQTVTLALSNTPSVTTVTISGAKMSAGNGTPEGAVVGSIGDLFLRRDGGAATTLYVKESGAATNTGWIPK